MFSTPLLTSRLCVYVIKTRTPALQTKKDYDEMLDHDVETLADEIAQDIGINIDTAINHALPVVTFHSLTCTTIPS